MSSYSTVISIIDDDEIFQMLIKKILDNRVDEAHIVQFSNGFEALLYFKEHISQVQQLPSVIFLDLNMPAMNGWQFLNQLNKIDINPSYQPAIFIITGAANPDFEKLREYPLIKGYLTKPVVPNELIDIIKAEMKL